jgi:hypothetical protein
MIKALFIFPSSVASEVVDDIVTNIIVPVNRQFNGCLSMNTSVGAITSPDGPTQFGRIVEATFNSLSDVIAVGKSSAVQAEDARLKSLGMQLFFFEVGSL